jgi:hypothetical protein
MYSPIHSGFRARLPCPHKKCLVFRDALNGKVETQKRKKIVAGDTIEFAAEKIRIQLSPTNGQESHDLTGTAT